MSQSSVTERFWPTGTRAAVDRRVNHCDVHVGAVQGPEVTEHLARGASSKESSRREIADPLVRRFWAV